MGIGDKSILSVGKDLEETTLKMVDAMVDDESSLVSIYFGSDATADDAANLGNAIADKYEDLDIEINHGGQPIYYYIISVE
jgi:dihydroxyacetone kinase-like predicted kinase